MRFPHGCWTLLASLGLLLGLIVPGSAQEVIMDDGDGAPVYVETGGGWTTGANLTAGYNGGSYRFTIQNSPATTATWQKAVPQTGLYEVFAGYLRGTNRPTQVPYLITHRDGTSEVVINQNGSTGVVETTLGTYTFNGGQNAVVQMVANGTTGAYMADAIILRYVGGDVEPFREFRVIWADSWNESFLNSTQANDLINTARTYNLNAVMPQVRKVGDALYNSAHEPRATNISGGGSFDPLGYLIGLARDTSGGKKRIQVHAWFVMHRIALKSQTLAPQHPLALHPEWEMWARSTTQPPYEPVGGTQRYLDPGHPDVVDYNIAVILDCLRKYDIDGVNLDYIRYPESADGKVHGYNPVSIARFNAVNNRTGIPSDSDTLWRNWRRECVTLAVKKLYVQMWKEKPHVLLTTCTINWGSNYTTSNFSSSSAYNGVYQDWKGWLEAGIIDYNALMNYVAQTTAPVPTRYQGWTNLSTQVDTLRGSIIGIGAYMHSDPSYSAAQLLYARERGAQGLNIYDWGSEVSAAPGFSRTGFYSTIRSQVFPTWVDAPVPQWKSNPVNGIIEGHVYNGLVEVDHAQVEVVGRAGTATVTDGKGWFGILHLPPGNHTLRVRIPGKPDLFYAAQPLAAGEIQTVVIGTNQVRDVWGIF